MSDYTQAPATLLAATKCAVCGKPLLDAESLRLGVGPICVKRDLPKEQDAHRLQANSLIYKIAQVQRSDWGLLSPLLDALRALPLYGALADKIAKRLTPKPTAHLTVEGTHYKLVVEYRAESINELRAIQGRKFVKTQRPDGKIECANLVPLSERKALWAVLVRHYPGVILAVPGKIVQVPEQLSLPSVRTA